LCPVVGENGAFAPAIRRCGNLSEVLLVFDRDTLIELECKIVDVDGDTEEVMRVLIGNVTREFDQLLAKVLERMEKYRRKRPQVSSSNYDLLSAGRIGLRVESRVMQWEWKGRVVHQRV
jgi:hypothetical protein